LVLILLVLYLLLFRIYLKRFDPINKIFSVLSKNLEIKKACFKRSRLIYVGSGFSNREGFYSDSLQGIHGFKFARNLHIIQGLESLRSLESEITKNGQISHIIGPLLGFFSLLVLNAHFMPFR